ncbi:MAG: ABC transporter substrate-binding protein [Candidatus Rokubacteria bacterium]|nr:ABC transporter substrate-binding protein [Candidatus Rokubacteria bacterium]MBI2555220.1 ABC transporter substrate-binding protein [Candidatus Rokubacteria bacterium]
MEKITVGIDLATLTRREFLGRATQGAVVAAAAAVLPWDRALAQTKLNVGTMKIGDLSPFFLALERAFFKEAGLDINVAAMVGGAAVAPALASGALNIGWSNVVSIYQGHLQGFDYRFIANGAINKRGTNDVFGFQVAVDSPIRSAKDLEGKTLASNTLRNIIHVAGMHWIDSNGGDSSKVKWIELPFPQMEPALVNKQIDAFVAVEPFVTVPSKVNKKTKVLGYPLGGIAPRLLIAAYFASEAWIQKNGDTVKAFVAALNRGIDAHNASPEEAKATIAKHTGLKPELLKEMVLPAFERKILESDLQPMLDVAFQYKLIEKKFAPRQVISPLALA